VRDLRDNNKLDAVQESCGKIQTESCIYDGGVENTINPRKDAGLRERKG